MTMGAVPVGLNPEKIRQDFPLYEREISGRKIIYLDSACMSLKPRPVIDAVKQYYEEMPACAGRSGHTLGNEVTRRVGEVRKKTARFVGAKKEKEIVFTKNTTEGINLVAKSSHLEEGGIVLTSDKEHNSGLLPFQELKKKGVEHRIFEFGNVEDFKEKAEGAKLVSFVHTSNLDGTSQNAKELVKIAHDAGAKTLVDCAQSVPHKETNAKKLGTDFLAFSGHKMLGPTGTGALYGKEEALEGLDQFIVGGETVKNSTYENREEEDLPFRFEGGLQNYAGLFGLGAAIDYLQKLGVSSVEKHEERLNKIVSEGLSEAGAEILSEEVPRGGITSFNIAGMHNHEVAGILNESANVMVRSGMHCVHSWCNKHGIEGSVRASLYAYNTKEECETLAEEVSKIAGLA